jgi:hypothetical protein
MTNEQKIAKALELLAEATKLLTEVKGDKGGAKAFDGGSNPPGPGQPGHP